MEDKIVFLRLAFVATFFGGLTWLGKQKGAEILKKYPKWFGTKEEHIKEQQKRQKKPKPPKTNLWDQWKKLK